MKYKTILSTIMIILFITFQGPNALASGSLNSHKIAVIPTATFLNDYMYSYNITNDGLKDFSLLKTEFSVDAVVQVTASYAISWNHTKTGVNSGGGIPSFNVAAGTYNFSLFLGLAFLKNVNDLNMIVNGTLNLNLTLSGINFPYSSYGTFKMPSVNFSYNTSKISNRIPYLISFDSLSDPIANSVPEHYSYLRWAYNNSNVNGAETIVSEMGRSFNPLPNGTISMEINKSLYGFNIGKIYSNNVSLTADYVPVGYPFSVLKLSRNLSLVEFEKIFNQTSITNTYNLNAGILSVNSTFSTYKWFRSYNQTTGVLLEYTYSYPGQFESLHISYAFTSDNITTPTESSNTISTTIPTSTGTSHSTSATGSNSSSISSQSSSVPFEGMYSIISLLVLGFIFVYRKRRMIN